MIALSLDLRPFDRKARDMQSAEDQAPYALSIALNAAAKVARIDEIGSVAPVTKLT